MKNNISSPVIRRLPRYYRCLLALNKAGIKRISSGELAKKLDSTASQIRQDFNYFGGFGQQGYGYNVPQLQAEIGRILGLETPKKTILIGAGYLGRAIVNQIDFEKKGFTLIGIFEKIEALTGQVVKGIPVRNINDMDEFCKENFPKVAVLCVSKNEAEQLLEPLIRLGVTGFWNFSQAELTTKNQNVFIENVLFSDSLLNLSYHLNQK